MVSEQVKKTLTEARGALDESVGLGYPHYRTAYYICDGMLNHLKTLIHDNGVHERIQKKEQQILQEYQKKKNDGKSRLKGVDPAYAWEMEVEYDKKLRHWKSMELLSFWDILSKGEYEF